MDTNFVRGSGQPLKPRSNATGALFSFGNMFDQDRRSRAASLLHAGILALKTQVAEESSNEDISEGNGEEVKVTPEVSSDGKMEGKVQEPTFIWAAKEKLHALPLSERRTYYVSLEDAEEQFNLNDEDIEEGKRQRIVAWIETLSPTTPSDDEMYIKPLREYDLEEQRRRDTWHKQKGQKEQRLKKNRRIRPPSLNPTESRAKTRAKGRIFCSWNSVTGGGGSLQLKLPEFAVMGTVIEYVHNDIKPKTYIKAIPGGSIETPEKFHVILSQNWNELDKLMNFMNYFYNHANRCRQLGPLTHKELEPGLLIAVKNNTDAVWHRAIVLKQLSQRDYVQVLLIDYGETRNEHVFMTRPLLLSFVHAMKAQAIRCRIYWGKYYNRKIGGVVKIMNHVTGNWDTTHGVLFAEMMYDRAVAVKIASASQDREGKHTWLVHLHLLEERSNKVEEFHLERKFYASISGQRHIIDEEDETETQTQFVFSQPCYQEFVETKDMRWKV